MKLTRKKIKYLIREAVTSQIKHITPRDRAIRRLPHGYQYPENPEDSLKYNEDIPTAKEKIKTFPHIVYHSLFWINNYKM